jgi:hypothetical protein
MISCLYLWHMWSAKPQWKSAISCFTKCFYKVRKERPFHSTSSWSELRGERGCHCLFSVSVIVPVVNTNKWELNNIMFQRFVYFFHLRSVVSELRGIPLSIPCDSNVASLGRDTSLAPAYHCRQVLLGACPRQPSKIGWVLLGRCAVGCGMFCLCT